MSTASAFTDDAADRAELPRPGRWEIDPSHSTVGFWVRHMGVARVRGAFRSFAGTADVADVPERSSLSVTIDAASIDTLDAGRDGHVRSADFLDVERFPALTFTSSSVSGRGSRWKVEGDLTIRGVTRPVALDVEFGGTQVDGDVDRAFFTASTVIDRTEFGLTWNQTLETGGVLVGKQVHIDLDVQLVIPR